MLQDWDNLVRLGAHSPHPAMGAVVQPAPEGHKLGKAFPPCITNLPMAIHSHQQSGPRRGQDLCRGTKHVQDFNTAALFFK